jgi:predicted enzyme related to lactoylglutathione lyase
MPERMAPIAARYVHTNLVAQDWRQLAAFYEQVFGCIPVPPERHYEGSALERGTAVPGARLDGAHVRLPGHSENGPTLEIFAYSAPLDRLPVAMNRPGFGHIAFEVDDVRAARARVLAEGGAAIGEIVTLSTVPGTSVTWCYVTDPEGNPIELQSWTRP